MAKEIDVLKAKVDLDAVLTDTADLERRIASATESIKQMRKETNNLGDANEEQVRKYSKTKAELKQLQSAYRDNQKIINDVKTGLGGLSDALEKEVKSIAEAKKSNKELIALRNQLDVSTEQGQKALTQINDKIDENNAFIKENVSSLEKQKIGIGDYGQALDSIVPGIGQFISGLKGATTQALRFIATPLGAILAAIALVLASVQVALTKTQGGMDKMNRVMEQGGAILQALLGRVAAFGNGLIKLVSGNLDGLDEMKNAFTGIADEIAEVVEEAGRLADMEVALRQIQIGTERSIALLEKEAATFRTIEGDATRSFAEREFSAQKAREAERKRAEELLRVSQLELKVLEVKNNRLRQQGLFTDEILKEEIEARNKVTQAETELIQLELENEKIRRELKQDRLERDLDILIDGFDNQKTINERLLQNERMTFDERRKILEQTIQEGETSFDKQIATIQKFTDKRIEANDLLKTSDASVLNEKIRALGLSEIIEGRLLEVIRDRRTAEQDLREAEIELNEKEAAEKIKAAEEAAAEMLRISENVFSAEEIRRRNILREELQELQDQADANINLTKRLIDEKEDFEIGAIRRRQQREVQRINREIEGEEERASAIKLINLQTESEITNVQSQAAEERKKINEEQAAARKELAKSAYDVVLQLNQVLAERTIANLESERDRLDAHYERRISLAGKDAEAVKKLEDEKFNKLMEIDKKTAEANKAAFNRDKALRMASAAIDGAAAIVKALAVLGPFGAIATGAVVAAQLAIIGAEKLPSSGTEAEYGAALEREQAYIEQLREEQYQSQLNFEERSRKDAEERARQEAVEKRIEEQSDAGIQLQQTNEDIQAVDEFIEELRRQLEEQSKKVTLDGGAKKRRLEDRIAKQEERRSDLQAQADELTLLLQDSVTESDIIQEQLSQSEERLEAVYSQRAREFVNAPNKEARDQVNAKFQPAIDRLQQIIDNLREQLDETLAEEQLQRIIATSTKKFSKGGRVTGGIKGKDSVLSLLTPDEEVLTVGATSRYPGLAEAANQMRIDEWFMNHGGFDDDRMVKGLDVLNRTMKQRRTERIIYIDRGLSPSDAVYLSKKYGYNG